MTGPHHVVVMGVAGCGKSTVGEPLSAALEWEFAEGDDFHPEANRAKMRAGEPLTDADREPWLEALRGWTEERDRDGVSTVVSCSALRRAYRDILRRADPETFFVHLHGDFDLLLARMHERDHFMPESLLRSQFDTLEMLGPDEAGVLVDVAPPVEEVIARALVAVRAHVLDAGASS